MRRPAPVPGAPPGPRAPHLRAGAAAEQLACEHLRRHGLALVTRNFRCAGGELDLIMQDGTEVVVVEVRCRAEAAAVAPLESITRAKCRRIVHATRVLLMTLAGGGAEPPLRFDVVMVSGSPPAVAIDWIRSAFTADDLAGPRA